MNPWGKNSTRKRESLFIIAEILGIAKKGSSKTHLMYNANLSFKLTNEYLKFTLETDLLEESMGNNKKVYKATEKGVNFLDRFFDLVELLEAEENNRNSLRIPSRQLLEIIS
jgi:predicted transcriptional regulator